MSSSTVRAQRLANEANIQMTRETNVANQDIAAAQNDLNYKMFNEQNDWNLQRRNEEWEYNDASHQMQRYLQAGINPLWAMSTGDPGKAQPLESASPHPAVGATLAAPQMIPEYDPTRLGNIVAAAQNVSNSLQGFMKLGLDSVDVDTRQRSTDSQIALQRAESLLKKSQTAGQDILNNLNLKTADSLIGIKQREYEHLQVLIDNAKKEGSLTDAQIENARETKNQIIAMTSYTKQQADSLLQQVRQGWLKLSIEQQRANNELYQVQSESYYRGEDLKLRGQEFEFYKFKTAVDFQHMTNKEITSYLLESRGRLEKEFGIILGDGFGNSFSKGNISSLLESYRAAGDVLIDRLQSVPSTDNYKSYMEWQNSVESLPVAPNIIPSSNSANPSILNPSQSWQ